MCFILFQRFDNTSEFVYCSLQKIANLKKVFIIISFLLFLSVGVFGLSGCLKKSPESPPDNTYKDPDIKTNTSIQQLKAMSQNIPISGGVIISGVVVMSDKSGNYFKRIVIQDSTGGIEIELDKSYLYADFPLGRRVFVKCDSLFLGSKNGMMQLGYTPDANGYVRPVPEPMIPDFLFPGAFPVAFHPDTVSMTQLAVPKDAQRFLNTLVVLKNVEFADSNVGVPYAEPSDKASVTSRIIETCSGTVIPLQTSGYAVFQPFKIPSGKGNVTALYTCFKDLPQLYIRDTSDVHFYGQRCSYMPPEGSFLTILQLRTLFSGLAGNVTLGNFKISGIVISDRIYKNVPANSFVFQGGPNDAGIIVQLNQAVNLAIGDSLIISANGGKLENDYGSLKLESLATSAIQVAGHQKSMSPESVTISQIKANPKSFESRLVTIHNIRWLQFPATFNGQSGNLNFSDGTDSMSHFCGQEATFEDDSVEQPFATSITGYIFIRNNQVFLRMRNPDFPEDDLKN